MSTVVNTARVEGRRQLHFSSLDDILADVERLACAKKIRALGNWTPGQVLQHLANTMNNSIDGFPFHVPLVMRWFVRLFFKGRFLRKPSPPGFKLPAKAGEMIPPPTVSLAEGFDNIRAGLRRLHTETRRSPHPALGALSAEEWVQMHCRHSELHLSFLVPEE